MLKKIILFYLIISASIACATIEPTHPITSDTGVIIGFATNEPSTYLASPQSWRVENIDQDRQIYLREVQEDGVNFIDLRMTIVPDYDDYLTDFIRIKENDPEAVFFPLSMEVLNCELVLFNLLGSIEASYEPQAGVNFNRTMYYRLRFNESQFKAFRQLANGGLTLTGSVSYRYQDQFSEQITTAPIAVNINAEDLKFRDFKQFSMKEWMHRNLTDYHVSVRGFINGTYSLGGFMSFDITNSGFKGSFIDNQFKLTDNSEQVTVTSLTTNPNFSGTIYFNIPHLGRSFQANFNGDLEMTLSKLSLEITTNFQLRNLYINDDNLSFYKKYLNKILKQNKVKRKMSKEITKEFQRRILNENLFLLPI
ncbi:hypothetical protein [Spartinivicinus ruber]|uniref:hypothetical protein n=1 Tax=Spartinivicinus ruber TaxID=2683272 RepID=UPI0013D5CBA4|nr:hypothetical protein [Spartinivicinus ruber]